MPVRADEIAPNGEHRTDALWAGRWGLSPEIRVNTILSSIPVAGPK
jgi:hypothetical protein